MVTGFHGDHHDGAGSQSAGPAQRHHLGMIATGRLGAAGADDPTVGIHNDGPHWGFG